jgi:hypothetical protein
MRRFGGLGGWWAGGKKDWSLDGEAWVLQVLDSNASGGLTSQEFCAAMKKLVREWEIRAESDRREQKKQVFRQTEALPRRSWC